MTPFFKPYIASCILRSVRRNAFSSTISEVHYQLERLVAPHAYSDISSPEVHAAMVECQTFKPEQLEPKTTSDSYCEAIIPLTTDSKLRDEYRNFAGSIRTARILEDLDTMAVHIAYCHNQRDYFTSGNRFSPLAIVTAAVDKIEMNGPLNLNRDVKLLGNVCHVGTSSCAIKMDLEQEGDGKSWKKILTAFFVLVARNPLSNKSSLMNPLVDDSDRLVIEAGKAIVSERRQRMSETLLKCPPNANESALIHKLHTEHAASNNKGESILMSDTLIQHAHVCEPQQRNIYNKIFGGFLMRSSYELAWTNSRLFAKEFPKIVMIGDISFHQPVEIGSIMFLTSTIVYTSDCYFVTRVVAEVVEPETKKRQLTNTFYYIFETNREAPFIIPKSYSEYITYLDGKRHFDQLMAGRLPSNQSVARD